MHRQLQRERVLRIDPVLLSLSAWLPVCLCGACRALQESGGDRAPPASSGAGAHRQDQGHGHTRTSVAKKAPGSSSRRGG